MGLSTSIKACGQPPILYPPDMKKKRIVMIGKYNVLNAFSTSVEELETKNTVFFSLPLARTMCRNSKKNLPTIR